MSGIVLRLLGPPLLLVDGQAVRLPRRKSLALLCYLKMCPWPHSRDTLASLFWPDCGQAGARANLRSCLFSLTRALGARAFPSESDTLRLAEGAVDSDVEEFRGLALGCRLHDGEKACAECLPFLRKACDVYRADFLAGFTLPDCRDFDLWQFREGEVLRDELGLVLKRLVRVAESCGRTDEALAAGRRLVDLDPLDEEAHRTTMRLHLRRGEWSAAERRYRECENLLAAELDREPEPATAAVFMAATEKRPSPAGASLTGLCGPIIGRDAEIAEIVELIGAKGARLLTLTGPGGVGKTRLARRAAAVLSDRFSVYFVDLAPVREVAGVMPAIASALGVAEARGTDPALERVIREAVRGRRALIVLDNFEQVLGAGGSVSVLLEGGSESRFLVTSREALGVGGERVYPVRPLDLPAVSRERPSDPERIAASGAVRLFLARASLVRPEMTLDEENAGVVERVCAALDGLPLAIELAAARLDTVTLSELASRLNDGGRFLIGASRERPRRQRTLTAVFDWSYHLLGARERRLFDSLSVFFTGCSLRDAERIRGGDEDGARVDILGGLTSLVSKNLLGRDEVLGESRYRMLEPIREYASSHLAGEPDREAVEERHARVFLELAEEAEGELRGPDQMMWLERLESRNADLHSAINRFAARRDADASLRMASALGWYAFRFSRYSQGKAWLEAALSVPGAETPGPLRAKALRALGWLEFVRGRYRHSIDLYKESLSLFRGFADIAGESRTLSDLGIAERWHDDHARGDAHCLKSVDLARKTADPLLLAGALIWAYTTTSGRLHDETALRGLEEAALISERIGEHWLFANAHQGLADVYRERGEWEKARGSYARSLSLIRDLKDDWLYAWSLEGLGRTAFAQARYAEAYSFFAGSLELFERVGDARNAMIVTRRLAELGGLPAPMDGRAE